MKKGIKKVAQTFALILALCATSGAWAADKVNPVTGETESYTYSFTGAESAAWNVEGNWSPAAKPYINGVDNYNAALVDGDNISIAERKTITEGTTIEGWALRVGLYNGAQVTFSSLNKMQGTSDMWITVDDSSKLTITSWGGGYIGDTSSGNPPRQMDYSVASENGITFSGNFSSTTLDCGMTYNYYLKGQGSVSYQALGIGFHKIKKADVTLSNSAEDTRTVERKKLVAFTSCTKTFTADATITVGGTVTDTKTLTTVTQNATTLTAAQAPGTCELVQISSGEDAGLWLYYVENGVSPIAIWTPQQFGVLGVIGTVSGSSYWSTGEVPADNADVAFAVSQDADLYVDVEKTLGDIYVFSTSSDPVTLRIVASGGTLVATKVFVPANVTLEVQTATFAVPVQLFAGATLNLNFNGTWANAITGSGSVKVYGNAVTFSTANTFTGGLTVVSGGHAKTTNSTGYGPSGSTNITVQDGGALDIAGTNGSNYGASIEGEGVLVDSVRTGALYSSVNCGDDAAQWYAITLNGNATIKCNENYNWGLLAGGYNATAINLGTYTLTKAGGGDFWLCYATISGSGTLSVSDGKLKPIARPCTGSDATIEIGSSGQLKISANSGNYQNGTLTIKNISCASGGSGNRIEVDSGKTLTVSNAMTVNGSASVAGTLAGAGTATVMSTGTMSLTGACTISSLKVDRSGSITVKDGIDKFPTAVGANDQVKGVAGTGDTTYSIVKVAKTSDNAEYYTMAEALAAIDASSGTLSDSITLIEDTTESFVIPRTGFALDTDGYTTGAISGASGVGVTVDGNVYTGTSNTATTWTGSAGDNLFSNAQNWSTKSVPTSSTSISFGSGTYEVGIGSGNSTVEVAAIDVASGGKVMFRHNTSNYDNWPSIKVCSGNITGSGGTIVLKRCGLKGNAQSPSLTVDCDLEFLNDGSNLTNHDSWIEGATFTINGDITGTGLLKISANTTINGSVTLGNGAYLKLETIPSFGGSSRLIGSGSGTVILTKLTSIDAVKTKLQHADWNGVCELTGSINLINFKGLGYKVRANSLVGYPDYNADGSSTGGVLTEGVTSLEIVGTNGLVFNDSLGNKTFVISAAITGSSPIKIGTQSKSNGGNISQYIFTGDVTHFSGQLNFNDLTDTAAQVYFTTDTANVGARVAWETGPHGSITVMSDAKVNIGATWTAPGGFVIDGEAAVSNDSGVFSSAIAGSGKLSYYGTPSLPASGDKEFPKNVPTFGASWSGDIEMQAVTLSNKTKIKLPDLSAANRKLIIKGIERTGTTSVYLGTGASASILGTTQLDGNLVVSDGNSSTTFTWNKITGSGNMTLRTDGGEATPITHAITTLDDYSGTIDAKSNKAGKVLNLTIGTVNVPSLDLTVAEPIVRLASDANLTTSVDAINVTVANESTTHKLCKAADGNLYVRVASVTVNETTTYYSTLTAAADAAMSAGGETIQFALIEPEAGTSLPGWTYEDGVFTRTGYAYNATTKTEYSTLAGAVAAASEGDTIQLLYGNSETAVDTTGKDFVFDENGYAFTGTWTGSGRIVLSAAPSTTTWSSARFVADGWTGTVTLDWEVIDYRDDSTTPKRGDIAGIVNKYGIAASTVEIGRNSRTEGNCYFNADTTPKLKVSGFLYINDGSSTTKRTVSSVCGEGVFVFGDKADTVNYGITNLDDWNGILTNKSAKVTVGTVTRGDGVIYCSNNPTTAPTFTDTEGNRWTGRFIVGWNQTSSAAFAANSYGISGSTVEIPEDITIKGFIPSAGGAELTVSPTIDLSGSLTIDNGYGASGGKNTYTTFAKITGKGRLTITDTHQYYFVDTLENWDGELSCSGYNKIVTLTSGTGLVKFGRVPTAAPTTIGDSWRGVVSFGYQIQGINLNLYGTSNSTVALAGVSGNNTYLPDTDINVDVRIDGSVTINNGNPINTSTDSWEHNRVVKIDSLEVNAALSFVKSGNTSWGDLLKGWYYAEVLKCGTDGRIDIGNQFGLRIDAVDLVEAPSASSCVIPISLTRGGDDKSDGVLYGPNGVAGEVIPVTVGGVANGQKLVHATVNETIGLYLAVASVTVNETTTYYPTLSAVKTQFGDSAVTINLLENTSESVELAYGQVLDVGATTYTGTVSAADSSAKIVEDGTAYKVVYGTIFSVY